MTAPTKQPAADIDTLTPRELDAAVAEVVMGLVPEIAAHGPDLRDGRWRVPYGTDTIFILRLPLYSEDERYAAQIEAEIEQRGYTHMYIFWLKREVSGVWDNDEMDSDDWFKVVTATPKQRCRAALRAVMG